VSNRQSSEKGRADYANIEAALKEAMAIDGAVGVCLVDWDSGMSLGSLGGGKYLDLDVAAAGNTEVVRAKMRTMESLRLDDTIEDILITLNKQYHLIRLLKNSSNEQGLFLYLCSTGASRIWPWPGTTSAGSRPISRSDQARASGTGQSATAGAVPAGNARIPARKPGHICRSRISCTAQHWQICPGPFPAGQRRTPRGHRCDASGNPTYTGTTAAVDLPARPRSSE
jgi:hypothetical protein